MADHRLSSDSDRVGCVEVPFSRGTYVLVASGRGGLPRPSSRSTRSVGIRCLRLKSHWLRSPNVSSLLIYCQLSTSSAFPPQPFFFYPSKEQDTKVAN